MGKRVIAIVISVIFAVSVPFTAFSQSSDTFDSVKASVEGVISYKKAELKASSYSDLFDSLSKNAGDFSADWYYIALSRYGINCENEKSVTALKNTVNGFYSEGLEKVKVTDMQRVAFALLACNEDITDINGHNLLADSTYNRSLYKPLDTQGVNSLSYALLLLDSKSYKVPRGKTATRETIISDILDNELENGGYALFGKGADIDITSIVLQALAPYAKRAKVNKSINKCLSLLSKRQDESGAYKSFANATTAESTAQVILALTSLGINPLTDSRFIKNGNTLLDGLNEFRVDGGGYCHIKGYAVNNIATYQSLCALVSVYRFLKGEASFFDFNKKSSVVSHTKNKAHNNKKVRKTTEGKKNKTEKREVKKSISIVKNNNSIIENKTANKKKYNSKTEKNKTKTSEKSTVISEKNNTKDIKVIINKSEKTQKNPKKAEPLYIDFAILFLGYLAVVLIKSGGKK